MTAPVVVQSASANVASGTSVTATFGSTPTPGNMLIAFASVAQRDNGGTISGWTPRSMNGILIWTKLAGVSEPSSVTINYTGSSNRSVLGIMEISGMALSEQGADTLQTFVYAGASNVTSTTIPSVTPVVGTDCLLLSVSINENAYGITSYPAGYTSRIEDVSNNGTSDRLWVGSKPVANPTTSYGGQSFSFGSATNVAEFHIVVGAPEVATTMRVIQEAHTDKFTGTNVTTMSATLGATPTQGNLLIASYSSEDSGAPTFPSGWTAIVNQIHAGSLYLTVGYKVAGASESSTVTLTFPSNSIVSIGVREINAAYVSVATSTGTSAPFNIASVTPADASTVGLFYVMAWVNAVESIHTPPGYDVNVQNQGNNGGGSILTTSGFKVIRSSTGSYSPPASSGGVGISGVATAHLILSETAPAGATPTLVQQASGNGGATLGSTPTPGNTLLLLIGYSGAGGSPAPIPSGYTSVAAGTFAGGNYHAGALAKRVVQAGDSAVFNGGTGTTCNYLLMEWSGIVEIADVASQSQAAMNNAGVAMTCGGPVMPSSPYVPQVLLGVSVLFQGSNEPTPTGMAPLAGITELYDQTVGYGGGNVPALWAGQKTLNSHSPSVAYTVGGNVSAGDGRDILYWGATLALKSSASVGQSLAIDYIVDQLVGSSQPFSYRLGELDEALPPVYHADVYGKPVYSDALINPEVYGEVPLLEIFTVNASLGIDAAIYGEAGAQLGIDYVIKALATKNLALDYLIDEGVVTQVGQELEFEYQIGSPGGAHKDLAFHYKITKPTKIQQRGANLAFKYQILRAVAVGKNLAFKYKITEPTHVGSNLKFKYRVAVNTVAGANLGFTYGVQPSPSAAGSDFGFDFDVSINNLAGADFDLDYTEASATPAGTDLDLDWDAQFAVEIGSDLDIDAEIELSTPRSDLTFDYAEEPQTPFSDLELDAAIEGTTAATLTFSYQIEAVASGGGRGPGVIISGGFDWLEQRRQEAQRERRPTLAGSNLEIDYTIVRVIRSSLVFLNQHRAIVGASFGVDASVANLLRKDLDLDAERFDMYDQNAAILLGEMDPDLADMYDARNRVA